LYVDPMLPSWLPNVTLSGLRIGAATVTLRVWREGEETRWEPTSIQGQIQIEQRRCQPWATAEQVQP